MHRIQPLAAMERITRQYLCDHFDEILERVRTDNIGYVILDKDGNDGHVLCPAKWMKLEFNDAFSYFFTDGIRYAMEQQSSTAEIMANFIRRHLDAFDPIIIRTIIENIEEVLAQGAVIDPAIWINLKEELIAQFSLLSESEQTDASQIPKTTTISNLLD